MPGSVHVYNLNGERLNLILNGDRVGAVGSWSYGDPRFQLAAPLAVPRARHLDRPGQFANEPNDLRLQWDTRTSHCSVAIDGGRYPLDQDLLLFVGNNHWQLIDDRGNAVASGHAEPA
jgi:hypothetical protein